MDSPPEDDDGFAAVLAETVSHEGGWTFSKDSDGARVYCGVNARANPDWPGWSMLPDSAPAKPRRIDTPELRRCVEGVYSERYWRSPQCAAFSRWPLLRKQVFDCVVNHGPAGAVMRVQEACRTRDRAIAVDGGWGPATEQAVADLVAELGEDGANNALVDARAAFYERLAAKPGRKRYRRGWLRRAEAYRVLRS